jgi:hypothetical protein
LAFIVDFLVAFGIDSPFSASCFSGGNYPCCVVLCVGGVRDEEYVVRSDHANRLPARFAIDLAVLGGHMVRVVEYMQRRIEADAMFPPVEPILPRIPGEFHGDSRIYDVVYTLFVLG